MRVSFGLLVGLSLVLSATAAPVPKPKVSPELTKARLKAARQVYEGRWRKFRMGGGVDTERLYLWSCRWRDAERLLSKDRQGAVAAFQAHLERMKKLDKAIKALLRVGQIPPFTAAEGDFYRSEAESDLIRAKAR